MLRSRPFAHVSGLITGLVLAVGALAADPAPIPLVSELRLGALAHDPWSPERGSADITGEILFRRPAFERVTPAFLPLLSLGGTLSTAGKTSHLHAGLTWTFDLTPKVFIEAGIGGAIHDGDTRRHAAPDRSALGCTVLFRENAGIGYRITRNWSLIGTVEHLSNSGLCRKNRGLTNVGAMIGYTF